MDTELNDPRIRQAIFRYGLIAEALTMSRGDRAGELRNVAQKEYQAPDNAPVHVTVRTLERWIRAYKRYGPGGLVRRPRNDRGRVRAVSDAAIARAVALRKEGPARSTSTLIDILVRSGRSPPVRCIVPRSTATSTRKTRAGG